VIGISYHTNYNFTLFITIIPIQNTDKYQKITLLVVSSKSFLISFPFLRRSIQFGKCVFLPDFTQMIDSHLDSILY